MAGWLLEDPPSSPSLPDSEEEEEEEEAAVADFLLRTESEGGRVVRGVVEGRGSPLSDAAVSRPSPSSSLLLSLSLDVSDLSDSSWGSFLMFCCCRDDAESPKSSDLTDWRDSCLVAGAICLSGDRYWGLVLWKRRCDVGGAWTVCSGL